jgi:hypothetical protein
VQSSGNNRSNIAGNSSINRQESSVKRSSPEKDKDKVNERIKNIGPPHKDGRVYSESKKKTKKFLIWVIGIGVVIKTLKSGLFRKNMKGRKK